MARRHEDWNVGLAEDLRDPEFARQFLLGAIDEDVPLQVALGKVVRAMGVKEFAAKIGVSKLAPHDLRRYAECRIMPNRIQDRQFGVYLGDCGTNAIRHDR